MELKPGYKRTEVGVIPEDWCIATVGSLASFSSGERIATAELSQDALHNPIPVYGGNGISGYTNIPSVLHQTVVVGRVGQKCGEVYLTDRAAWITDNALYPRNLSQDVDISFLAFALSAAGLNSARLRNDLPLLTQIPFPPTIAEQQAIAKALSDADALIESLEQLIAKKRNIKQGAMQALLSGKRRLPGFKARWARKTLGELGQSLIGLTYKPTDISSDGTLVLRSSNVHEGTLRFEDKVLVNREVADRIMVRPGDILICVRNGSRDLIGKCVKITEPMKNVTFGAFMAVFRTPFHGFVYHQFKSDTISRQIEAHLGATINQITNKSLNSFAFPFPEDQLERAAIANILSDMDAEIKALDAKLHKARQVKLGLMCNLLAGAIRLCDDRKLDHDRSVGGVS